MPSRRLSDRQSLANDVKAIMKQTSKANHAPVSCAMLNKQIANTPVGCPNRTESESRGELRQESDN